MIASLKGKVTYKSPELRRDSYFVLEANGVGYKVYTPVSNLKKVEEGKEITVFTYLSVSEYALDLYGFLTPADKTFFTLLLDVPGIGAKSALGILEKTTMAEVQQAILANDPGRLIKLAGLGEKTAEKIVVTLKDKVASLTALASSKKGAAANAADLDAFEALVGFGYSSAEARQAIGSVDKKITDLGERVKQALKILGKH